MQGRSSVFGRPYFSIRAWSAARKCQSGSAAIEFALVAPVLIILLVGAYAAGYAFHSISSIHYALDDTARSYRLDPSLTTTDLQAILDKRLKPLGSPSPTLSVESIPRDDGTRIVRMAASYTIPIKLPMVTTFTVERIDDVYFYAH
jgi:Flp pilus assembly protein TadG